MMSSKNILAEGDDFSFYLDALDFDQEKEVVYLALDNPEKFRFSKVENARSQVSIGLTYTIMDKLASAWEKERAPYTLKKLLQERPKDVIPLSDDEKEILDMMGANVAPGAAAGLLRDFEVDKTIDDETSRQSAISDEELKAMMHGPRMSGRNKAPLLYQAKLESDPSGFTIKLPRSIAHELELNDGDSIEFCIENVIMVRNHLADK